MEFSEKTLPVKLPVIYLKLAHPAQYSKMKTDVFCFTDRVKTYGQDADEAATLIKTSVSAAASYIVSLFCIYASACASSSSCLAEVSSNADFMDTTGSKIVTSFISIRRSFITLPAIGAQLPFSMMPTVRF